MTIFVPEDKPKTEKEKVMASIGMMNADTETKNIAMGVIGIVMLVVPAVLVVASDFNILRAHLKMMMRNLREGFHHLTQRGAKVAPA